MFLTLRAIWFLFLISLLSIPGCSTSRNTAPIIDRTEVISKNIVKTKKTIKQRKKQKDKSLLVDPRNKDWRPLTYTVEKGDTLTEIALNHGLSYRELAKWNKIPDPNVIEVGMILKLTSPFIAPLESKKGVVKQKPSAISGVKQPSGGPSKFLKWIWPTTGQMVYEFGEGENTKGIGIAGESRQSVVASAPGVVVYSGNGIRAYGNMIIIRHNANYLSVYAKNSLLMVKEGQSVAQGQKISEIGRPENNIYQLHFEIRRLGRPVNPTKLLPSNS